DVIAHIAPPITCVFLLGIFWKGASATSAKLTLWIGSLLGVVVFVINKLYPDTLIGQTPFMMMAFYLFCTCVILQVVFSIVYPVRHTAASAQLYWKSPWGALRGPVGEGVGNYKVWSGLLLLVMAVLFYLFR